MEIRHLKNLIVISLGFMLLFTAYAGLQNLQSSLNPVKGLGVASLSIVYASLMISAMFLPSIIIKKIGCKWTLACSMCCYVTYTLANFSPSWYTLIPGSIIIGLGGAPLWISQSIYVTEDGMRYATLKNKSKMDVVNVYFGIFFLIALMAQIWGNLIPSLVFDLSPTNATGLNYTFCGADHCPGMIEDDTNSTEVTLPSTKLVYILMGIYTGCGVLAILLIVLFLDPINLTESQSEEEQKQTVCMSFLVTFRLMSDKRQLLLIPLTIFSGLQQGFLAGDYTRSYVTCALGIQYVGYVMVCFGGSNAVFCILAGKLSQYTGRQALFALATVTSIACIITLLLWKPRPEQFAVFFVFPVFWSLSDGICQTLLTGLYGVLFPEHKEAAFANYRLWGSLGYVITFSYSSFICAYVKIYIVLALLLLGMSLYAIVEIIEYRKPRTTTTEAKETELVHATQEVICHIYCRGKMPQTYCEMNIEMLQRQTTASNMINNTVYLIVPGK